MKLKKSFVSKSNALASSTANKFKSVPGKNKVIFKSQGEDLAGHLYLLTVFDVDQAVEKMDRFFQQY